MKNAIPWSLCAVLLVAASVGGGAMWHRTHQLEASNYELRRRVTLYCNDFAFRLSDATRFYAEHLASETAPGISEEVRQRRVAAFDDGPLTFGNGSRDGRASVSLSLQRDFLFCSDGHPQRDELDGRFGSLLQTFRESDDHSKIAGAVADMAKIAAMFRSELK